jgi:hypothetical protein
MDRKRGRIAESGAENNGHEVWGMHPADTCYAPPAGNLASSQGAKL